VEDEYFQAARGAGSLEQLQNERALMIQEMERRLEAQKLATIAEMEKEAQEMVGSDRVVRRSAVFIELLRTSCGRRKGNR
jgi:hypothetical protein